MENKQLFEKQGNGYNPFFPIVRLEDIIETISDKSIQWILNNYNHLYVEYSESKAITRNKVPSLLRRKGLWITYNANNELITEYFKGDNKDVTNYTEWTHNDNWERFDKLSFADGSIAYQHLSEAVKQLLGSGNTITNYPDDEDLTVKDGTLKLKDRDYDVANFSGLGHIILRKNIMVADKKLKNILTQDMINKENTVYEIRYDFDLNGAEITVPEGCVLDFQGGSFSNGTLNGDSYLVESPLKRIFINLSFRGQSVYKTYEAEWFIDSYNDYADITTPNDSSDDLEYCLNCGIESVRFNNIHYYYVSRTIYINNSNGHNIEIVGNIDKTVHEAFGGEKVLPGIYTDRDIIVLDYWMRGSQHWTTIKGFRIYTLGNYTTPNTELPIIHVHNKDAGSGGYYGLNIDVDIHNKLRFISNYKGIKDLEVGSRVGVLVTAYKGIAYINLYGSQTSLWCAFKAVKGSEDGWVSDIRYNNYTGRTAYGAIVDLATEFQVINGNYQSLKMWTKDEREPYFKLGNTNVLVNSYIWDCRVGKDGDFYTNYYDVQANVVWGTSYYPNQLLPYCVGDTGYRPAKDNNTKSRIPKTNIFTGLEYNPITTGIYDEFRFQSFVNSSELRIIEGDFNSASPDDYDRFIDIKEVCHNYVDITNGENLLRQNINDMNMGAYVLKSDIPYESWYIKYKIKMNNKNICNDMLDLFTQALLFNIQIYLIKGEERIEICNRGSYLGDRKGGIVYHNLYKYFDSINTNFFQNLTFEFVFTPALSSLKSQYIPLPVIVAYTPNPSQYGSFGGKVFNTSYLEGIVGDNTRMVKGSDASKSVYLSHPFIKNRAKITDEYQSLFRFWYTPRSGDTVTVHCHDHVGEFIITIESDGTNYNQNSTGEKIEIIRGNLGSQRIIELKVKADINIGTTYFIVDKIILYNNFNKALFYPLTESLNLTNVSSFEISSNYLKYGDYEALPQPKVYEKGKSAFESTLKKPLWWTGYKWVDHEGYDYNIKRVGTFEEKPSYPNIGFSYFCTDRQTAEGTTNGIMIYHKGNNVWVDALGRVVV